MASKEIKIFSLQKKTPPPLRARALLWAYIWFVMLPLSLLSYIIGTIKILSGRWKSIPFGFIVPPQHQNTSTEYGKLVTISISHYCLKTKWALRRSRIPFVEEKHAPLFHISSLWYSGGRNRGTPLFIEKTGNVIWDSTAISHYLHKSCGQTWLFPNKSVVELDKELDKLGAATRMLAYRYVCNELSEQGQEVLFRQSGWLEKSFAKFAYPVAHVLFVTFLKIDNDQVAAKSLRKIHEIFDKTDELLKDGRKYIANTKELSAADITLCSLAYPIIFPPQLGDITIDEDHPLISESWKDFVKQWRERPTGQYILRIYETEFK